MTPKIVLAFFILIAGLLGMQRLWSNYDQKQKVKLGRVALAVEDAKSNGKKEIQLPAPIPYYASVTSLDEALANYSTVMVRTVFKQSQIGANSKEIETWYKLAIIDYLSQPSRISDCVTCRPATEIPTELRSIAEDELIIARNVGSVVSDDIRVSSIDLIFPDFEIGRQYLLFVSVDPNTHFAELELGPAGVSIIDTSGELRPISEKSHKLNDELASRFGKVEQIKEGLKLRKFPQQ